MPFIDPKRRDRFEANGLARLRAYVRELQAYDDDDFTAGDLAFIVYALLQTSAKGCRFERRNAMMGGAEEGVKTWRRLVHDFAEDQAFNKNGEIV